MTVNKVRQWVKEFGAVNFGRFCAFGDVFNVVVKPCKGLHGVYYVHGRLYNCGAFVEFQQQGMEIFPTEKDAIKAVVKLYNMKEVFRKLFGLEPMSAEDREAFAVGIPVAVCVVLAFSFLALV